MQKLSLLCIVLCVGYVYGAAPCDQTVKSAEQHSEFQFPRWVTLPSSMYPERFEVAINMAQQLVGN